MKKERMMKDYRVKIQIRNDRLLSAIEGMGYDSVAKFCKKFNLEYQRTTEIIRGKLKPLNEKGTPNKTTEELLGILGLELHEAFTKRQLNGFRRSSFEVQVEESELKQIVSPAKNQEMKLIETDVTNKLDELFAKHLGPRQEKILRMRYGIGMLANHTYEEIGLHYNITRERVRQIEQKAIQILSTKDCLRELASTGFYEVFTGIDVSKIRETDDKIDTNTKNYLDDNKKQIDSIYNYHLSNLEEHTKKYPNHLKKFFLSKFRTEYSKITNRITAEKFIFTLPRHIQGYCKDNWMYNQLRDIVYSYAATKHKYKALCLIEKLQKRRQAIFYISKVREDGTLTVGDNEKLKKIYYV